MSYRQILTILILSSGIVFAASCSKSDQKQSIESASSPDEVYAAEPESGVDYHSFANTADYRVTHVDMDLTVDFSRKVIAGTAVLQFDRLNDENNALILDTRDLTIESVRTSNADQPQDVSFSLSDTVDFRGAPLTIEVPANSSAVVINYQTSPAASGLQWLEPRQTAGKRHPFLFTQAQAIHARSFVPLQDTPGVRITYSATVRTPRELRAVMSANNDPAAEKNGVYSFTMPQAIPSYLLALAVGDLEFKPMGARTGVYAEKEILDAAAAEFADTEAMLETTEEAYGPYRWDRYDLLILPPSFPFGGMENPRLSFITPTVIAGDKSLVALIAHELAHSWSGNLVTNSSWRDLWLNEGFTTYLTNRIMQFVYGDDRYHMEMALGYADLQSDLEELDDPDELLAIDKRGRDPDEAFSNVPYEKGSLFLFEIEQKIGREAFDQFLLDYFNKYAFQSITTEGFLAHLDQTLLKTHVEDLDADRIREWIFEPGIPEGAPHPQSDAFTRIDSIRQAWLDGAASAEGIDTSKWTYHQWKHFLDGMPDKLSREQMEDLEQAFKLTTSTNNEIAFSWLRIAIRNDYEPAYGRLEDFLTSIGRNKFLRPLYQDLMDSGKADMASRIFEKAKPGYHPLTVKRNSLIIYPDSAE
ncbi:MAG: M1 family metallopeptidase [Gammaproteobacteria bacterium]|nr:M1 family metallopeptidase [Gammaproteobacteria bacterium]